MRAFSRLKRVLKQQRMSVPELHRTMQTRGIHVNIKSLYRLVDDSHPVDRLDMRVAGAICQACDLPLSDWIVFAEDSLNLQTLTSEKQSHLDALMAKNNEGRLTGQERKELQLLVREAEQLTIANARLLAQHDQRLGPMPVLGVRAPQ